MNLKIAALAFCVFLNFSTTENYRHMKEEDTIIAVIDSRIDSEHELLEGRCMKGSSFLLDENAKDPECHGTAVAGAALKYADITSKFFLRDKSDVVILPIEIDVMDTQTDYGYILSQTIRFAVDSGADVINMSFSSTAPNSRVYDEIRYGMEKGVIFVSAAGNSGYGTYSFPASYEGVVSVGSCSLTGDGRWRKSDFSNSNDKVDLVFQGENMLLPSNSTLALKTGTSFSAGALSGIIAELISEFPQIEHEHILYALYDTAASLEEKGCGYGAVNISKAAEYLSIYKSAGIPPSYYESREDTSSQENFDSSDFKVSAGKSRIISVNDKKINFYGNTSGTAGASNWENVLKAYAGSGNVAAIDIRGNAMASGHNLFNRNILRSWVNVKSLSLSENFTAGLTNDGSVYVTDFLENMTSGWKDITQIDCGSHHLAALDSDGRVFTAGYNAYGQMDTYGWKNIRYISAGKKNTYGIDSEGRVLAAGDNFYNQCQTDGWKDIVKIAAGDGFVAGLKSNGTVVAKGRNISGTCNVEDLKNIVFIDASDTYLVAVDENMNMFIKGKLR
ncbi:MAG: S8 family serine peptidase [Sedimentibacter sp.]|uniref:S8 family serine peptidase n=1 Tax=Sedimentibacter sp. TaxID=1960295 RepID=UPI00315898A3